MICPNCDKSFKNDGIFREALASAALSLLGYEQSHGTGRGDEEAFDIAKLLGYDGNKDEELKNWLNGQM